MTIELSDYNPEWPKMFEQEVQLIAKDFPIEDFLMEHVGSTSVRDLKAKPVIDIMVGVPSLPGDITPVVNYLEMFGYQYMERYNLLIPERRFFQKDRNGIRTHQIHLTSFHSDFWNKLLFFRDQLRNDSVTRQQYQKVKSDLVKRSWNSVNDYASAKSEFIESVDQRRRPDHNKKQSVTENQTNNIYKLL